MEEFKDLSELDKYADEYPDKDACKVWIEDGVAMYLVHRDIYEGMSPDERAQARKMGEDFSKVLQEIIDGSRIGDWWKGDDFLKLMRPREQFYNGYVRFKEIPLINTKLQDFVPVHRGISYAEGFADGSYVYGFDTNHVGDGSNPDISSTEWLMNECRKLAKGLIVAGRFESDFCNAEPHNRIHIVQKYVDYMNEEFDMEDLGFGAMMRLLSGDL